MGRGRGPKVRCVIYCCLADKDLHERIMYLEVGLGFLVALLFLAFSPWRDIRRRRSDVIS